jgi:23S rRNA pseudouridine1911/1915/1917 synthase
MKKYGTGWQINMNSTIDESRIVYISEHCIVVNKLCGENSEGEELPAEKGMISLPRLLEEHYGGTFTAVHRLDVPVTGCALFARTPRALSFLNAVFAEQRAEKIYWGITEFPSPASSFPASGELTHWIETDPRKNKSAAFTEEGPGRKKGILRYRTIGQGEHYLYLEIELITGRHHQIRTQLAKAGLHIKGDLKYGARRSEKTGGIRLHARSLRFPDPDQGTPVLAIAAPPLRDPLWEDFAKKALAGLEKETLLRG